MAWEEWKTESHELLAKALIYRQSLVLENRSPARPKRRTDAAEEQDGQV